MSSGCRRYDYEDRCIDSYEPEELPPGYAYVVQLSPRGTISLKAALCLEYITALHAANVGHLFSGTCLVHYLRYPFEKNEY